MPPVSPSTVFFLCCISLSRSIFTLSAEMPCGPQPCAASSYRCDEWSSAFDGMQPTFRHVPPSRPRISMHAVFSPSWPALIAAG